MCLGDNWVFKKGSQLFQKYMKNAPILLYSLVKYLIFGLEADFCVDISSKTSVKMIIMEQIEAHILRQTHVTKTIINFFSITVNYSHIYTYHKH